MTTKIEWTDEIEVTWKSLPSAREYLVSRFGNVLGPSKKLLNPMVSKSGHLYVFVHRKRKYIHRLVLETFVGVCPYGHECRHLDGDPTNNSLDNLSWGTRQENANDRRLHGRMPIPHESKFTKLKPDDIPVIKFLSFTGYSSRSIGKIFDTSHTTIQKILRSERWKGY